MNKIQKIAVLLSLLVGAILVFDIFNPKVSNSIKEQATEAVKNNILGEEIDQDEEDLSDEDVFRQIKDVSTKVTGEEFMEEVTERINIIVTKKYEEVKDVPEEQLEKVQIEIKKEIYQGICEDWLKKELVDE